MFGQRKNKTFNYKPKFSKKDQIDFDSGGNSQSKEFITKWRQQTGNKVRMKGILPARTLILLLVLLLICMYLIEKNYL